MKLQFYALVLIVLIMGSCLHSQTVSPFLVNQAEMTNAVISDFQVNDNRFRVTCSNDRNQISPAVYLLNGRIYNTWSDNREEGIGYDIRANVLDWLNPSNVDTQQGFNNPVTFKLHQNVPNPFNPATPNRYELSHPLLMTISLYSTLGQRIAVIEHAQKSAGTHTVEWFGNNDQGAPVPAGIYICRLLAGTQKQSIKLLLK